MFKLFSIMLILVTCVGQAFVPATFAEVSEATAASALKNSEAVISSAYQSVLKAEQAGANVSDLLTRLNDAGDLLARARAEYNLAEFDEVVNSSGLVSEIGESVNGDANKLWADAFGSRVFNDWITIIGSLVGMLAVGVGSIWTWRLFRSRYYRQVLRLKPEVVSNES